MSFNPRSRLRLELVQRDNPRYASLFERVYSGKATFKQCVRAQCLDCMGFETNSVKDCGDNLCPLWHKRPFQRKESI